MLMSAIIVAIMASVAPQVTVTSWRPCVQSDRTAAAVSSAPVSVAAKSRERIR